MAYIERGWDGSAVTEQVKTIDTYTTIDGDTIQWNNGWYVAQSEVTIGTDDTPQRVTVTGDVHLILTDGCTLTVNGGIQVAAGSSLTIYGQSDGADTMGKLTASITSENTAIYNAAIGGNTGETGGTLTVCGGAVEATVAVTNDLKSGSNPSQGGSAYGAAIGGGGMETGTGGDGGTAIVYGGAVKATVTITNDFGSGSKTSQGGKVYGAAIGGGGTKTGGDGGTGGIATVYGGAVEATVTVIDVSQSDPDTSQESGAYGAAIGGGGTETGNGGDGGTITIFGGTVRAESSCGAGIGGGSGYIGVGGIGGNITISGGTVRAESVLGAGIGGGSGGSGGGDGGKVTISGGAVRAESYYGGGIGGGCDGDGGDTGGDGGTITISGGTVEVQSVSGAGIGGGNSGLGFSGKGTGGSGGNITISGGSVTATTMTGRTIGLLAEQNQGRWAGAAIGGSSSDGSSGNITISGGTVTAIVSSQTAPHADPDADPIYSAGIGSGRSGGDGTITISGGTVFAQSPDGAGIGSGENSDGSAIVIAISGGTVEAVSTNGAGIGGGMIEALNGILSSEKPCSGGDITIAGGTVSAQSTNGAGIGGGALDIAWNDNRNVNTGPSTEVTFTGGGGGTITINGGTVEAVSTEGVGIGSGGMPFYQSETSDVDQYIHRVSGAAGTFTTGPDGNAMLIATGRIAHIEDDDTSAWQGVIFLGSEGQIYGDKVTLSTDCTIPGGKQLTIGEGQSLLLDAGVTLTIDNENCLTGAGTLGAGGSYQILNPMPVFTPATLVYTGGDLSGSVSLTAPAGPVSVMGQVFTISGSPNYDDWVITTPAGGILQVGTYTVTAYSPSQGRTVSGQITVIADSSSTPTYSVILPGRVEGGTVTAKKSYAQEGETFRFTVTPDEGYALDALSVTDGRGRELDLREEGGGEYSFKMPASRVTVEVAFRKEAPVSVWPFTDVGMNDWYYDAVEYIYENDLMNGTSANTFSPFVTTSRAMMLTILARYDGVDTSTGSTWYEAGAVWAIADGVSDGTNLEANLTREQLVTMLWRYAGSPEAEGNLSGYPDSASVSDWAVNAMIWAVDNGIITGNGVGALAPQGTATRAEVATILMRF